MQCEEVREQFADYVNDSLQEQFRRELAGHLRACSACRKELDEAEGKVEILLKQNGKLQPEPYESIQEKTQASKK